MSENDIIDKNSGEKSLMKLTAEQDPSSLVEITVYIREGQAFALESLQIARQQSSGQRVEISDLVQEALDLLIKRHFIAVRISKD
ncbi:MAG: hypothetical protein AB1489_01640 [Acidobacteriota bacterium]